jgi:3',5'-cyclic AMP phosphodiesterase CpdA
VKIAHFSDVHALSLEGAKAWQFLSKRAAGYLNLRLHRGEKYPVRLFEAVIEDINRERPDEVVCTGDLVNLSLEAEFQLARTILDRLALGPSHVTVVPGNHDVYTLDALIAQPFWRVMRPYAEGDRGESFPTVRERGELAIIGVSTARPSPVPFADGAIGRKQLAALEDALARLHGRFRILLLHHPPYRNRHWVLRGLRDRGALARVLRRVGCELVLHGHEHRDLRRELDGPDGPIPVIGVGSGSYRDERPDRHARYNLYTIEDGQLRSVETRVIH